MYIKQTRYNTKRRIYEYKCIYGRFIIKDKLSKGVIDKYGKKKSKIFNQTNLYFEWYKAYKINVIEFVTEWPTDGKTSS